MGISIFIVVLIINVMWLLTSDLDTYLAAYRWKESKWLSVGLWVFAIWGISNLIYVIYNL